MHQLTKLDSFGLAKSDPPAPAESGMVLLSVPESGQIPQMEPHPNPDPCNTMQKALVCNKCKHGTKFCDWPLAAGAATKWRPNLVPAGLKKYYRVPSLHLAQ